MPLPLSCDSKMLSNLIRHSHSTALKHQIFDKNSERSTEIENSMCIFDSLVQIHSKVNNINWKIGRWAAAMHEQWVLNSAFCIAQIDKWKRYAMHNCDRCLIHSMEAIIHKLVSKERKLHLYIRPLHFIKFVL